MIKGRATIQLFDEKTGEVVRELHEENMITNAVDTILNPPDYIEIGMDSDNDRSFNMLRDFVGNIADTAFRGVIVCRDKIPEDGNNMMLPWTNEEIGHAGIANTNTDTSIGTYNANESGRIENGKGYRHVWDFASDKANGEIKPFCGIISVKKVIELFPAAERIPDSMYDNSYHHGGYFYDCNTTNADYVPQEEKEKLRQDWEDNPQWLAYFPYVIGNKIHIVATSRYIQAHENWKFAGLYYDEGISGTKKEKRSELMRLLSDCEAGRIDFIITKSISRFARNTTDCLEMVRKLLAINVAIYFEKENINTTSMESELVLAVLSSLAESESVSISGNEKWSIRQRFQSGTYKMNPPPYGYRWNGEQLEVNNEQAEIVKRIFAEFLSGKGVMHIARNLDSDNIVPARGKHWCQSSILRILKNENYTGNAVFQKTFTDESFHRCVNYGQLDKYLVADHHEGIISKEDFDVVAALIERHAVEKNVTKGSHKYQLRYCFSGKIVCGECGATLKHRTHRLGGETYESWCCSTHIYNKESCSMKFIRDDDIKLAFVTMMNKLVFGHKLILKPYLLTLRSSSTDSSIQRIQQLRLLIEQNTGQQETLTRLMANGFIDRALFGRELNAIMAQTDEYRAEIDTLSSSVTGDGAKLKETERLIKLVERGRMFTEFDADLFSKLVDRIWAFSRNEIGFVLKCGLTLRERIGE